MIVQIETAGILWQDILSEEGVHVIVSPKTPKIDARVAQDLGEHGLSTADFTPMQALGVPGWWPDQDDAFYNDATVFRPKRAPAVK